MGQAYQRAQFTRQFGLGNFLDRQALEFIHLWRTEDKMLVAWVKGDLGVLANPVVLV
jgi:hypothetical protein